MNEAPNNQPIVSFEITASSRALELFPDYIKFIESVLREVNGQSNRGIAIICGAMLEESLKKYIKSRWRSGTDDKSIATANNNLWNPSGPLGTFSAKIDVAFVAKLIGPQTYHDLHIIRGIRNDFAHKLAFVDLPDSPEHQITFSSQSVADRCGNLINPRSGGFKVTSSDGGLSIDLPKGMYVFTALNLSWTFMSMTHEAASKLTDTKICEREFP